MWPRPSCVAHVTRCKATGQPSHQPHLVSTLPRHVVCLWDADNVFGLVPASGVGLLGQAVGLAISAETRHVDHRVYANPSTLHNTRAMDALVTACRQHSQVQQSCSVQVIPVSSRRYGVSCGCAVDIIAKTGVSTNSQASCRLGPCV